MMFINKVFKRLAFMGLHIYAFLKTYIFTWVLLSPFYCLVVGIMEIINGTVPLFISRHFLVIHLLVSLVFNTVMFILLEIKTKGLSSLSDRQEEETGEQ